MIIALDDCRDHLCADVVFRNAETAITFLSGGNYIDGATIIVDHDLGLLGKMDGHQFMVWLETLVHNMNIRTHKDQAPWGPEKIVCCSDNPVGRKRIEAAAESIMRIKYTNPMEAIF